MSDDLRTEFEVHKAVSEERWTVILGRVKRLEMILIGASGTTIVLLISLVMKAWCMVLSDIVTGIQLVKQSVDFIKSSINTAKDVNDIVGAIDNLLDGEQQINAKRSKKDGIGLKDQFGIKSVAHEVIDAKIAAEERYNMSVLIDQRFGHGTFKSIVDLRAKRIQEAKERAKVLAGERQKRKEEIMEMVAIGIGILLVGVLAITVFGALLVNAMERGSPSFREWYNGS